MLLKFRRWGAGNRIPRNISTEVKAKDRLLVLTRRIAWAISCAMGNGEIEAYVFYQNKSKHEEFYRITKDGVYDAMNNLVGEEPVYEISSEQSTPSQHQNIRPTTQTQDGNGAREPVRSLTPPIRPTQNPRPARNMPNYQLPRPTNNLAIRQDRNDSSQRAIDTSRIDTSRINGETLEQARLLIESLTNFMRVSNGLGRPLEGHREEQERFLGEAVSIIRELLTHIRRRETTEGGAAENRM